MFKKSIKNVCIMAIATMIILGITVIRTNGAETKDDIGFTITQNNHLMFIMGVSGAWEPKLPEGVTVMPHAIDPKIPISGRFNIYDLVTNLPFYFSHPFGAALGDKYACWNLQVDDTKGGWVDFKVTGNNGLLGNEQDGGWSSFYTPTNAVHHVKTFETDPTAGITCNLETRHMHDAIKFKWRINNTGTTSRYAGMKLLLDLTTSSVGDGNPYVYIPGHNFFETMTVLKDIDVPETIEVFNDPQNPTFSQKYMFTTNGATKPDIVGIDDWDFTSSDLYSYFGSPTNPLFIYEPPAYFPVGDKSLAILWKPRVIPAGKSIEIITYVSTGRSTGVYNKPTEANPQFVPAIEGPRALSYGNVILGAENPPFTISAFLDNQSKYTSLTGGTASLVLPDGLVLDDSDTDGFTKYFGAIGPGAEGKTEWIVKPTGTVTGILEYSVSLNANPVGGAIATRKINVPATPTQQMSKGWQMISMPFRTAIDDSAPPSVPGGAPAGLTALGISGNYGTDYKLWEYNTKTGQYVEPTELVPGTGYWLWSRIPVSTSQADGWTYSPLTWNSNSFNQYELKQGWNLIGNPFVYTITLGEYYFYHPDFGTLTYGEAIQAGLISKTLYTYDTIYAKYRAYSTSAIQIKPWQGYWIKALRTSVTLLSSPASQIGANLNSVNAAILNPAVPSAKDSSSTKPIQPNTKTGPKSRLLR
ncbi:MAG: hypothetical protein ACYC0V_15890 [Armatimonadota bacterium]